MYMRWCCIYSYLNASAGLVRAANHVWLLTVASATTSTPANPTQADIDMLLAKLQLTFADNKSSLYTRLG